MDERVKQGEAGDREAPSAEAHSFSPAFMKRLRLSPSASVTPAEDRVLLRSDLGTFAVSGKDVRTFLERIVPLLDGSRDGAEIAAALGTYTPRSVEALLGLLDERGLLERVEERDADSDPALRGQDAFLRRWGGPAGEPAARLARAHVAVVGLGPVAEVALRALARSGLARIDVVGPPGDALSALGAEVAAQARRCRVEARPSPSEGATLWVVAVSLGDAAEIERISRLAHHAAVPSLWGALSGGSAILGPLVKPGLTACRVCAAEGALNPLAPGVAGPAAHPQRMAGLLGSALALEAQKVLFGYAESTLAGQVSIRDLRTLEARRHMLVRLPWCRVCGARPTA